LLEALSAGTITYLSWRKERHLTASIMSAVKEGQHKYCETVYSRSGINHMWILKNSKDLLDNLQSRSFSQVSSIKTWNSDSYEYKNKSASRGAQFVPIGMPTSCWNSVPPKETNMLSMRNSSILITIPASPAYGVYISQLIRYARASSNYSDFLKRHLHLRNRLLDQGYNKIRLIRNVKNFFTSHIDKKNIFYIFVFDHLSLYIFTIWKSIV
jgi:hypothetical protein